MKLKSGDIIRIYSSLQKRYYDVLIFAVVGGVVTLLFSDGVVENVDVTDLNKFTKY